MGRNRFWQASFVIWIAMAFIFPWKWTLILIPLYIYKAVRHKAWKLSPPPPSGRSRSARSSRSSSSRGSRRRTGNGRGGALHKLSTTGKKIMG